MERQVYLERVDRCLERVATWLETFDPDEVDFRTSDGVVRIEFPDGQSFVLNRQAGSNQVWYAAGARAWHYDWNDTKGTWVDDRDGHDLYANVRATIEAKLGRPTAAMG
ncbi:MAG: iron donor protein CyaY [Planctomycetaceae bacterium]|nr:iron donor protein CyaY [Planctomycetaceae bacterium]